MPRPSAFTVGQRVYDKRDRATGTLIELKRHTNGSPKWLVQWDKEQLRAWCWEVDLRPVAAVAAVAAAQPPREDAGK